MSTPKIIPSQIAFKFVGFSVFFLSIFYFERNINTFIYKYLTVTPVWSNTIIDSLLCFLSLFVVLFIIEKIVKPRYLFSRAEFSILVFIILLLIVFTFLPANWYFTNMFHGSSVKIPHISLVFIVSAILLISGVLNKFNSRRKPINQAAFSEDNAITLANHDLLNYQHIAKKLHGKIKGQQFECSFTVGIIGPWGNGKSSFMNLIAEEFKTDEIIPVIFHPYLNHTEAEISSEFFHAFQQALKPYSGKLSNLVLEYSNKLMNFYNDKNLGNFIKKDFISSNSSAYDTYQLINKALSEVSKKIVVFVDDLDRLNQDEILQVLKLIRNTANFRNTIFIVAMDKGYVLSRLSNDNLILSNKFVDKFFQLEIYLPEIDKSVLQNEFIRIIDDSTLIDAFAKIELNSLISTNKVLFSDHIKNLRDVKRLCNQIIFEYDFINEEIALPDFINFILLKLTFPQFLDLLKRNPLIYLTKNGSYYHLKTMHTETDGLSDIISKGEKILLEQYQIYHDLQKDENCLELNLPCEERKLLTKTLIYLFGEENRIISPNSIKYENNFRRFMQLDYKPTYFLNKNFKEVTSMTEINNLKSAIKHIIESDQQFELLDRLNNFHPDTREEFQTSIFIFTILFDTTSRNKLSEPVILRNLAVLIEATLFIQKKFDVIETSRWIQKNIFESQFFDVTTQLRLIGYLWDSKKNNKLWDISTQEIERICIDKFEEYLSRHQNNIWDVNDFTFYNVYYKLKSIGNIQEKLKTIFEDFLTRNRISTFCAQSISFEAFNENIYSVSNGVTEFFPSKFAFKHFVETHEDSITDGIIEYIHFLTLNEITKYSSNIAFNFKDFKELQPRIDLRKQQNPEIEVADKISQVFFKVHDEEIFDKLQTHSIAATDSEFRLSDLKFYFYNQEYYLLLVNLNKNNTENYLRLIFDTLKPDMIKMASKTKDSVLIDDKIVVSVYSAQP